jgi:hypothetical protein
MAFTQSFTAKTVFGNLRCHIMRLTADAAEGNVATGLRIIDGFATGGQSMTTGAIRFAANENSSGTAAMGTLGISGAVSGDEFFVTVWGK